MEQANALQDINYQGDMETTPPATSRLHTNNAHSSSTEASTASFSGWMFKMEE